MHEAREAARRRYREAHPVVIARREITGPLNDAFSAGFEAGVAWAREQALPAPLRGIKTLRAEDTPFTGGQHRNARGRCAGPARYRTVARDDSPAARCAMSRHPKREAADELEWDKRTMRDKTQGQEMLDHQAKRLSELLSETVWVGTERGGWTVFIGNDFLYPEARSFNVTHDKLIFAVAAIEYAKNARNRRRKTNQEAIDNLLRDIAQLSDGDQLVLRRLLNDRLEMREGKTETRRGA